MKVAVTSQGKDIKAQLDPRFGRCQYILIYDLDTNDVEVLANQSQELEGGAGIQTAQKIADKDVKAVITGHIGPNAFKTLSAAGIDVYSGNSGLVSGMIDHFKKGKLQTGSAATVDTHHGMNIEKGTVNAPKKKIAVAVDDASGLHANISAHFGRCPFYTIIEIYDKTVVNSCTVENPFYGSHGEPGQVPSFIKSQESDVIISGGMGPKAIDFFTNFGIEVVTGAFGKVDAVIQSYMDGSIKGVVPCKETHGS
jgi:predicted Fe-Mo cluster-binding NifX family protein